MELSGMTGSCFCLLNYSLPIPDHLYLIHRGPVTIIGRKSENALPVCTIFKGDLQAHARPDYYPNYDRIGETSLFTTVTHCVLFNHIAINQLDLINQMNQALTASDYI